MTTPIHDELDGPFTVQEIRSAALDSATRVVPLSFVDDDADQRGAADLAGDLALDLALRFEGYIARGDTLSPRKQAEIRERINVEINAPQSVSFDGDPYTLQALMRRVSHLEAIVMPIPKVLSDTCDDCGAETTGGVTGTGKPTKSWCDTHAPAYVGYAAADEDSEPRQTWQKPLWRALDDEFEGNTRLRLDHLASRGEVAESTIRNRLERLTPLMRPGGDPGSSDLVAMYTRQDLLDMIDGRS